MSVMNQRPAQALFEDAAQVMGIADPFVEKDWFVTQVIGIIAGIQQDGFELVFTGGTALSKAHNVLRRFSEDIDFRVCVGRGINTRKQRSVFKHGVVEALRQAGFHIEDAQVSARDENRFFSIDLAYDSYFPPIHALRPHILLELTVRDMQLPAQFLPVSSFVHHLAKRPPEVARVGCIDPVESAADKLSALVWRIPDRVRGGPDDDRALVRHLHDLAILEHQVLARHEFPALVEASMREDLTRPKHDTQSAVLPVAKRFRRLVNLLRDDPEYATEYAAFIQEFSYAAPGATPDFAQAVAALRRLLATVEAKN